MTSRRQELRRKGCLGKKTFRSVREALAAINEHQARYILSDDNKMNVYKCKFGMHLHIGHVWDRPRIGPMLRDFPLKRIQEVLK